MNRLDDLDKKDLVECESKIMGDVYGFLEYFFLSVKIKWLVFKEMLSLDEGFLKFSVYFIELNF